MQITCLDAHLKLSFFYSIYGSTMTIFFKIKIMLINYFNLRLYHRRRIGEYLYEGAQYSQLLALFNYYLFKKMVKERFLHFSKAEFETGENARAPADT